MSCSVDPKEPGEDDEEEEEEEEKEGQKRNRLQRQSTISVPSPLRSANAEEIIRAKRKLGQPSQSICETGLGCGSRPPLVADEVITEGVSVVQNARLHPLISCISTAPRFQDSEPSVNQQQPSICQARSVPEMDSPQSSSLPYKKLDSSSSQHFRLPGQMSSQTASFASEGSQVRCCCPAFFASMIKTWSRKRRRQIFQWRLVPIWL